MRRLVLVVALTGCGSIASEPRDAGLDVDEAAVVDVAMDAGAACVVCPADPPEAGAPCVAPETCEYARTGSPCRHTLSCQSGTWLDFGDAVCASDASACGPSLAATEGAACDVGSRCDFGGASCICWGGTFVCDHPTSSCPVPRPMAGSACPEDGIICKSSEYVDLRACDFQLACRTCAWKLEWTHTCP